MAQNMLETQNKISEWGRGPFWQQDPQWRQTLKQCEQHFHWSKIHLRATNHWKTGLQQTWPWNSYHIKVIPCSCSTRSKNTVRCIVQCAIRSVSLMVILAVLVTMTTFLCTPRPPDYENAQEDKGKMSDAVKQRLNTTNSHHWLAYFDYKSLKGSAWCVWDVAYLTNFSLIVLSYL